MTQWSPWKLFFLIALTFLVVNATAYWAIDYFRTQFYLTGHRAAVHAIAFVGDGQIIATASGQKLRLYSVDSGKFLREVTGHTDYLTALASCKMSEDIVSSSADGTIKVWKVPEGIQRHSIAAHRGAVRAIRYSSDGSVLVSIGDDKAIRVWNPSNGERLQEILTGHSIACLAVDGTGYHAVTDANGPAAIVWDLKSRKESKRLPSHAELSSVAFSRDGSLIALGDVGGAIELFHADTGDPKMKIDTQRKPIMAIVFSYDDRFILGVTSDGAMRVWDIVSSMELPETDDALQDAICIDVSEHKQIAVGERSRTAVFYASKMFPSAISRTGESR